MRKNLFVPALLLLSFAVPAFASTHRDLYNVPCNELWRALKDTLRNSGKYGIISIDNDEMTASYNMGGNLMAKRVNSAVLNRMDNGANCELQIQTAYSGAFTNDAGDLRKRVDESLAKLKNEPFPSPAPAPSSEKSGEHQLLTGLEHHGFGQAQLARHIRHRQRPVVATGHQDAHGSVGCSVQSHFVFQKNGCARPVAGAVLTASVTDHGETHAGNISHGSTNPHKSASVRVRRSGRRRV